MQFKTYKLQKNYKTTTTMTFDFYSIFLQWLQARLDP